MISRQWRGLAKREQAEDYVGHLRRETFPEIQRIPGFISASILRRDLERGVEFLVVTQWESLEAIGKFAGSDVETAVVPKKVQDMMIEYDRRVRHFDILDG
jgi:heme-degrading monooxygenase HmoA